VEPYIFCLYTPSLRVWGKIDILLLTFTDLKGKFFRPVVHGITIIWKYVEIKYQLDATDGFFNADVIACSTCLGHHYAHHQELKDAAASCKPDTQPTAAHQTNNLKTKPPNTTGSNHLYNTLELLMMGIMVPRNMLSKQ
jgi:hypothetical protein